MHAFLLLLLLFCYLQGHRDQSLTFGFREGLSTLDIRRSNEELEQSSQQVIHREVYVRRPGSRSSTNSEEVVVTPPGPFGHKHFRMIDASACDLRDPIDRNRKDSITSNTSIIMNEQYRQQQQQQAKGITRSRHSSITSTSTMRSNREGQYIGTKKNILNCSCQDCLGNGSWWSKHPS